MFRARFLSFLFASLLLCSCVVTEQDLQRQRDLLEMKRRLGDAERALKELQDDSAGSVRARVETLSQNQADFQATLDSVRVDLQSMQGRSGDQERTNEDLRQNLTLLRDEFSLQIADHERRLNLLASGGTKTEKGLADQEAEKSAPQPEALEVKADEATNPTTPEGESAPELYERALKEIREGRRFTEGRELMKSFLSRYPEDALAVNAAYWVGETFYAEKDYEKAILQFEEIIQKYGEHPKVASAMLKQALAFESTGDKATSRLLLQRVVERFPLSGEAGKAKQKLSGQ